MQIDMKDMGIEDLGMSRNSVRPKLPSIYSTNNKSELRTIQDNFCFKIKQSTKKKDHKLELFELVKDKFCIIIEGNNELQDK